MLAAQGGANLIYGAGMLALGMTFDLAQLLIDAEIFKMVLHTLKGFEVNEDTLVLDVIKDVGTGQFVSHSHTRNNYKKIQSHSHLINRQGRGAWVKSGSKGIVESAYEKVQGILETHKPEPLDSQAAAIIRSIIVNAEAE